MLRFGLISDTNPAKGLYKVNFDEDDLVSQWIPKIEAGTKNLKVEFPLAPGTHVACLMDEHMENGVILGAVYDDGNSPAFANKDKFGITFPDGTYIKYDNAAGTFTINTGGKVIITAAGNVEITCDKLKVTGNVEVTGKVDATLSISSDADVVALKSSVPIALALHKHSGVTAGGAASGPPIP